MSEQLAWYQQEKWLIWLYTGVQQVAVTYGLYQIEPGVEAWESDELINLFGQFTDETKPLAEYLSPAECARDFKAWASTKLPAVPQSEQRVVSMKISKHYGGVTIELGISSQFTIQSARALSAAFDTLAADLKAQFEAQERLLLPTLTPPQQQAASSRQQPAGGYTITFVGDTLDKEVKGGKEYFKVRGGQYSRHGVRVWPEVLKAAGIDPASVPADGMPLGRTCEVEIADGKIRKVTKIQ